MIKVALSGFSSELKNLEEKRISNKTKKMLDAFKTKHGIEDVNYMAVKNKMSGAYLPGKKLAIGTGNNPAVMLHELGHAADFKKHQNLKILMRQFPLLASLTGLGMLSTDETRKYAPIAPIIGTAPIIYQEGKASGLALKHLYDTGKQTGSQWKKVFKGVKSLSPGMLSYIGAAAIPSLALHAYNKIKDNSMNKLAKDNNFGYASSAGIGAGAAFGTGMAHSVGSHMVKTRQVRRTPQSKKIGKFIKNLKPGDILLESDPKDRYTGRVAPFQKWEDIPKSKKGVIPNVKRKIANKYKKGFRYSDIIQAGGGGSPYHHASVYLGGGRVLEAKGDSGPISGKRLSGTTQGKRLVALRASEDPKIQQQIIAEANKMRGKKYPTSKQIGKRGLNRTLMPIGGKACKAAKGGITCSELPATAIEKATKKKFKIGVNARLADPTDILHSKKLKPVATYKNIPFTRTEKGLLATGQAVRNLKWVPIGAAVGFGMYGAKKMYDKIRAGRR